MNVADERENTFFDDAIRNHDIDPLRALLHDMRQPVATILLLAQGREVLSGDTGIMIADQAAWLAALIDNVLDDTCQQPGQVSVGELIDRCRHRQGVPLHCRVQASCEASLDAHVPRLALERAVTCLLDNAVRAAEATRETFGQVVIRGRRRGDQVLIEIADNGPGWGSVMKQNGLGLPTTRAMIAACHGTLEVSRRPNSVGLQARITVPRSPVEANAR